MQAESHRQPATLGDNLQRVGVPELAPVGNVQQANEALKPPEVQARQVRLKP
jgi:hypothetical protein